MKIAAFIILTVSAVLFSAPALADSLTKDAVWSGAAQVRGQLVVERGVTLTIEPGTVVSFLPGKPDEEGLADSGMLVKGTIVAVGKPDKKIKFTSGSAKPSPGDWGEIKLIGSAGSAFTDCDFSCGGWGLHLHESDLAVRGCSFHDMSYGGIRMKAGQVEITGCDIRGMEVGIRYWMASPSIHHNNITGNGTGIFCRQDTDGSYIRFNNICGNSDYDIKLGELQKGDIDVRRNWWGSTDITCIRKKIYDRGRDGYVGNVLVEPVLTVKMAIP